MISAIKRHARLHRFLDGQVTIQIDWKLPDILETFQLVWKLSRWFGNLLDDLETFWMIWKLSRWFGNFPDDLKTY